MEQLKNYIYEQVAKKNLSSKDAVKLLKEMQEHESAAKEIAIIGISCRFPKANDADAYWQNTINGVNCISEFPKKRRRDMDPILISLMANPDEADLDKLDSYYDLGAYLDEVDKFDPAFFRISPREGKIMDPWQRIWLEMCYLTMEDAGYGGTKMVGSRTGVFVGRDNHNYSMYKKLIPENDTLVATGSWPGVVAGRVAYVFDFIGPAMIVDTACSSGLVAVHQACKAIQRGDCDQALAGGMNVMSNPWKSEQLKIVEANDTFIKTFDRDSKGTAWGEGVGVILLKPLKKALADGDRIYAVIKGSAINNDGTSNGITAPKAEAQEDVITRAWEDAGVHPETIAYVETHGTGTVLGDPIEAKGLTTAFRRYTQKRQICAIGSVKPSVGHLVAASGVSSLFKVILALYHKKMPPTINFDEPNQFINFVDSPIYVNNQLRDWPQGEVPRRAGVSAFGFAGTNVHVVLEEAPVSSEPDATKTPDMSILALSGRGKTNLESLIDRYHAYLADEPDVNLQNLCYTANTGRGHYAHRIALLVRDLADLREKIVLLRHSDWTTLAEPWFYYGEHRLLAAGKETRDPGEITEEERRQMTKTAFQTMQEWKNADTSNQTLLSELSRLYIGGADVDWEYFYSGEKYAKVRLPLYPLERTRYWFEAALPQGGTGKTRKKEIDHPLLDRCLSETIFQDTFVTDFSVSKHWVLRDHKVMDSFVIPGTTYLEMAREAAKQYLPEGKVHLYDVFFMTPLALQDGQVAEVQTILKKEEDHLEFTIASQVNFQGNWVKHAIGKIAPCDGDIPTPYDLEALQNTFVDGIFFDDPGWTESVTKRAFTFGPHWGIGKKGSIDKDRTQILAELFLPDAARPDFAHYTIHPSLMDQAANLAIQSVGEGMYLPLSYKSMKLYGKIPEHFFVYLRKGDRTSQNREVANFDITLLSATGETIAEITDYTIKKVREAELKFAGKEHIYYDVQWVQQELPKLAEYLDSTTVNSRDKVEETQNTAALGASEQSSAQMHNLVLLFNDRIGVATDLATLERQRGNEVVEVEMGTAYAQLSPDHYTISGDEADYDRLLSELNGRNLRKIVHLANITGETDIKEFTDLLTAHNQGVYSLFYLTRALSRQKFTQDLSLFLVSDYSQRVSGDEPVIHPHHAAMTGLGKVLHYEHGNITCRAIDIDQTTSADVIDTEMQIQTGLYQVAYRGGKRYVPQLGKVNVDATAAREIPIQEHGVYIITGGTGGLGLEVAKYLAKQGPVHLALFNRTALPERSQWDDILDTGTDRKLCAKIQALREIEAAGATVETVAVDVSQYQPTQAALEALRGKHGRILGVVHSAGVAGDGFLILKDDKIFSDVLAPKVLGTWVLDHLTLGDHPDFFVNFSSITALMGAPGQGDYTAANTYLDAFATYQAKRGTSAFCTINWAPWKETGMAVDYGVNTDGGIFKSLSTADAMDALDHILHKNLTQVVIGELNYQHPFLQQVDLLPLQVESGLKAELSKRQRMTQSESKGRSQAKRTRFTVSLTGRSDGQYTPTETILAQIWGNIMDLKEISIYDDFYALGGDSLLAIKITNHISEELRTKIEVSDLFQYLSIAELAKYLDSKGVSAGEIKEHMPAIVKAALQEYYPLTSIQQRIYILEQFEGVGLSYNVPVAIPITGKVDWEQLEWAFNQLIERQEALRTYFTIVDGKPVQKIEDHITVKLERVDAGEDFMGAIRQCIRPFDITQAPLCRGSVIQIRDDEAILVIDTHHLISDGTSIGVIGKEILALLTGQTLPPLAIQYKDYAVWEQALLESGKLREQESYWLNEFRGELPVLNFPTDYPRPAIFNYAGETYQFTMDAELVGRVKELAKAAESTLFTVLLSIYSITLARYAGQDEVLIGTVLAGRTQAELENMVGVFLNNICFRCQLTEDQRVLDYLGAMKDRVFKAFENQQYPINRLINQLDLPKDMSRNPLFDVMLILQNFELPKINQEMSRKVYQQFLPETYTSKYDMTLYATEKDGEVAFDLEYCTSLFKRETIEQFGEHFLQVARGITIQTDRTIGELELLTAQEKERITVDFNTPPANRVTQVITRRFEVEAACSREKVAICKGGCHISYGELNGRANRLARKLQALGVGKETMVGVMVERSPEMIVGLLAILKAGGAYLPLDPTDPVERLNYIISDSQTAILLTQQALPEQIIFTGPVLVMNDTQLDEGDDTDLDDAPALNDLAYVIYTSGSTGQPKGVMVEHRNLAAYVQAFEAEFRMDAADVVLQQASYSFDAFVEEVYPALVNGGQIVIAEKWEVVDVTKLTELMTQHGVTMISCSPLLLNELNHLPPVPSVHTYISGGDVLKAEYISQLVKVAGVYNTYGPTEATVCATYYRCPEMLTSHVPIGRPIAGYQVYIMNQQGGLQPIGIPGELCIAGVGVARGYWNRPDLTAEKFVANPQNPTERIYRSGDLARWLPDGNVEFMGRIDAQVKIRGYRIELGEIEATLISHPEISEAIVIDREGLEDEKALCAYFIADKPLTVTDLRTHLATTLPEYMIPAYFVQLTQLPLLPSGKVDRKGLVKLDQTLKSGVEFVAPRTELEEQLARIWGQLLNLERISVKDNFFTLGGHSLLATRMISLVNEHFGVKLSLKDAFQARNIEDLAKILEQTGIPGGEATSSTSEGLIKPFNLATAPLIRADLISLEEEKHLFVVDMHHIISDGTSMEIFIDEFKRFYQGESLPELRLQYKDYAEWENQFHQSGRYQYQEQYWLSQFAGELPRLNLPLDFPRPEVRTPEGRSVLLQLDQEMTQAIRRFTEIEGVTLFMFLLAAYNVLLMKHTGQEDIIVGTPVSGRTRPEVDHLIGMFVNTLALRNQPVHTLTFRQFLQQVKDRAIAGFANQDYQFDMLVQRLNLSGDLNRNPLFDTLFSLEMSLTDSLRSDLNDLTIKPYQHDAGATQFDLSLIAVGTPERIVLNFRYDATLFQPETIEAIAWQLKNILLAVMRDPNTTLNGIDVTREHQLPTRKEDRILNDDEWAEAFVAATAEEITPEELQHVIYDYNRREGSYPANKLAHQLFEDQVERMPDRLAVMHGAETLTYRELNTRANYVAQRLIEQGVKTDELVAISVERSVDLIVGILGVLKAGAAFLPFDIEFPIQRARYLIKDTGARFLLTQEHLHRPELDEELTLTIDLDTLEYPAYVPDPMTDVQSSNLAYVIYTSGSTGMPKGVMVEHQALVNRICCLQQTCQYTEHDTVLQKNNITFDGSLIELLGWFMGGGRLAFLDQGAEKDPRKIIEAIIRYHVTSTEFAPTMLNAFLNELTEEDLQHLHSLRLILVGGEQAPLEMVQKFNATNLPWRLRNLYGPTEGCIYVSEYTCTPLDLAIKRIPIGKPIANTRMYILNGEQKPVPQGMVGELYLGGTSLARGYWNLPELTEERFLNDPFYPGERMYKTGDLVEMLPDGNIVFLGRMDQQTKIRGFRVELGEIESALLRYEGIQSAAVLLQVDAHGEKYLAAYLVIDQSVTVRELRAYLFDILPDHMVPAVFFTVEQMPLSASGKLDRQALTQIGESLAIGSEYVAPRNTLESTIADIWSMVLNCGRIGIDDDFFELGGESLRATHVVAQINQAFGIGITIRDIFEAGTVRMLSDIVVNASSNDLPGIVPIAKKDYYPTSSVQKRMYILNQLNHDDLSYNLVSTLSVEGKLDKLRLEEALRDLVQRHESLRTSFEVVSGEIVQIIHDQIEFAVGFYTAPGATVEQILCGEVIPSKASDVSVATMMPKFKVEGRERRKRAFVEEE